MNDYTIEFFGAFPINKTHVVAALYLELLPCNSGPSYTWNYRKLAILVLSYTG